MSDEPTSGGHSALKQKRLEASQGLRHGTFLCDGSTIKNFVYVPSRYNPPEGAIEGVLKALGLDPPQLAFSYDKGYGIAPPSAGDAGLALTCAGACMPPDAPNKRLIEERVRAVLDGISDACAQTSSIHVLQRPFLTNKLSELVCDSCRGRAGCVTLGMFTAESFTSLAAPGTDEAKKEAELLKRGGGVVRPEGGGTAAAISEDESEMVGLFHEASQVRAELERQWQADPDLVRHADRVKKAVSPNGPRRTTLDKSVFEEKGATEATAKEVTRVIEVSTETSEYEEAWLSTFGDRVNIISSGLLPKVTHALVFETDKKRTELAEGFLAAYATGIIVAGGTAPVYRKSVQCLKTGRPVFIFEGTGGTSKVVARLVRLGKLLDNPKGRDSKEVQAYIDDKFPLEPSQSSPDGDVIAEATMKCLKEARTVALNFPERFNKDAVLSIPVGVDEQSDGNVSGSSFSVEKLQDDITKVMASVYDHVPELGGREAERRALRHAATSKDLLERAAKRYRLEATSIQTLLRLVFVCTASGAIAQSELEHEDKLSGGGLQRVNVALPLIMSFLITLYSTYRPMQKFAALWAAAKRLEGEAYRFRTRTGAYRAAQSSAKGSGHRQRFATACEDIFRDVSASDVRGGTLTLVNVDTWADAVESVEAVAPSKGRAATKKGSEEVPTSRTARRAAGHHVRIEPDEGEASAEPETAAVLDDGFTVLSADKYLRERLIPALRRSQQRAPMLSRRLKLLQALTLLGSAVVVTLQSFELPAYTPIVLAIVAVIEFSVQYMQLESELPAANATTLALTRVLVWWDGLSLIQQRMPSSKHKLVDLVETALLMQEEGFVQGALANLAKEAGEDEQGDAADAGKARKAKREDGRDRGGESGS